MMTVYFCTLCEKTWDQLPDDAVQLTTTKRGGNGSRTTYSIHVITKQTATNAGEQS